MNELKEPEKRRLIEKAIGFLDDAMRATGKNPKPVIFHSIRVGLILYNDGYNIDIVIAGILHDVVEDSSVTLDEIRNSFGNEVAKVVEANTNDESLSHDRAARDLDTLTRCKALGRPALLVKAADILENWEFFTLIGPNVMDELFQDMTRSFLEASKEELSKERVWQSLSELYFRIGDR